MSSVQHASGGRPESAGGTTGNAVAQPPQLGLYVHFPWCVKKCPYCDFNSHPLDGELPEDTYVGALTSEFRARASESGVDDAGRFDSLFFGGGTPSLLSAGALGSLIDTFRPWLRPGAEITMEANPGAAERDDLAACRDAGINRLSIGAQSFSPQYLSRLGRIHGPDETRSCFEAARDGGFDNINLDIMYALPGQTAAEAVADLEAAIACSPDHLSWYQLTIEQRTEFARRPPPGLPGEEAISDMEDAGRALLEQAGFARYEISAYARPGSACLHNLVYWSFGDYLGLGAGAHGKHGATGTTTTPPPEPTGDHAPTSAERPRRGDIATPNGPHSGRPTLRTRNPRQPRLYLQNPRSTETIQVNPAELPGEFMMNALRLVGGVERSLFETRTGLPWSKVEPIWEKTTDLGLTERDRIAATPHGLQHLDTLVQYFL
ncbi:MAG: radical SAM family heme chaperone HemW [Gammaproteobacteria bacterium]|nr:radical SAM family heme chaperone HemW [Gammaproteobacteria bacterium]